MQNIPHSRKNTLKSKNVQETFICVKFKEKKVMLTQLQFDTVSQHTI